MKYCFHFRANFDEFALAMIRELHRRDSGASFCGMVEKKREIYDLVSSHEAPPVQPLVNLAQKEREWLSEDFQPEKLREYEDIFGTSTINRMVASSREIGHGWISHSYPVPTKLKKLMRDSDTVRKYLVGLLDFLFEFVQSQKPDLFFTDDIASHIAHPMAKVAAHFDIPFRTTTQTRTGSKYLFKHQPEDRFVQVDQTFQRALADESVVSDWLPEARNHLEEFRNRPKVPDYSQKTRSLEAKQRSWGSLAVESLKLIPAMFKTAIRGERWALHHHTALAHKWRKVKINLRSRLLKYRNPFLEPGSFPKQPFAYYPLHITPEVSTMVYAPFHTDQLAVVENLAKSLPMSMELVVKENLKMLGHRPPDFYRRLNNMPGVTLASPLEDTFRLIQNSEFVCTISGTVGWEALQLKKPALVLGETFPFLEVEEGLVHCPDPVNQEEAIEEVRTISPASDRRLVLYLSSLFKHSFEIPRELHVNEPTRSQLKQHSEFIETMCDLLLEGLPEPKKEEKTGSKSPDGVIPAKSSRSTT